MMVIMNMNDELIVGDEENLITKMETIMLAMMMKGTTNDDCKNSRGKYN